MAVIQIATMSGAQSAFLSVLASAVDSNLVSAGYGAASETFWTPGVGTGAFTHLCYDPGEDSVIVHNSIDLNPSYIYPNYIYAIDSSVSTTGWGRQPHSYVLLRGDTLHPAGSAAGSGGDIVGKGMAQVHFPGSGGGTGISIDPNTNDVYQHFWHFATGTTRGGGTYVPFGYGQIKMISATTSTYAAGIWWVAQWDGTVALGEQVISSNIVTAAARPGRMFYGPGYYLPPPVAVFLNDIVIFTYADPGGQAWISCRLRPATGGSGNWRGTRSMPFAWPMALCPMGVDRVIVLWWAHVKPGAPLVYTVFRYDRAIARLRLEDVGDVTTQYTYTYPFHVGYATYDMRRARLILLSPNPNQLDQLALDEFCHPGIARQVQAPVALDPMLAGYGQRYAVGTWTGATALAAPLVTVSYPGFASTDPSRTTTQLATVGPIGAGTFAVSWTSGASGASGTIVIGLSSYSVAISATFSRGVAYGTVGMGLIASTATFTVSTTLSAAIATSTVAMVTITPRIPVSQVDAVGAGSPRMLSYPTSALVTPFVYNLNPQQTIGFHAGPWTRPLYAEARTLDRTSRVQFAGHFTDLTVTEIWMGGGNRIAMALSQFAGLYDLFFNVPDVASVGYIQWSPRDISNRTFNVLLTNLTVGGNANIMLDTLAKTGSGWVHDEVRLEMALISEVL